MSKAIISQKASPLTIILYRSLLRGVKKLKDTEFTSKVVHLPGKISLPDEVLEYKKKKGGEDQPRRRVRNVFTCVSTFYTPMHLERAKTIVTNWFDAMKPFISANLLKTLMIIYYKKIGYM